MTRNRSLSPFIDTDTEADRTATTDDDTAERDASVTMTADERVATYLIEDQMADLRDAIREVVQDGTDSLGSTRVLATVTPGRRSSSTTARASTSEQRQVRDTSPCSAEVEGARRQRDDRSNRFVRESACCRSPHSLTLGYFYTEGHAYYVIHMDTSTPAWALILDSLYRSEQVEVCKATEYDSDCLVNKADLDEQAATLPDNQINRTIRFLENNELLRETLNENGDQVYALTQDGFSVAHDRHILQKQQSREQSRARNQLHVNRAIGYLTAGLLVVTALNPIIQYVAPPTQLWWLVLVLINLLIVGFIIYKLRDSGLLTSDLNV